MHTVRTYCCRNYVAKACSTTGLEMANWASDHFLTFAFSLMTVWIRTDFPFPLRFQPLVFRGGRTVVFCHLGGGTWFGGRGWSLENGSHYRLQGPGKRSMKNDEPLFTPSTWEDVPILSAKAPGKSQVFFSQHLCLQSGSPIFFCAKRKS